MSKKSSNITLKDLADKIGFNVSTISRVLNGKGDEYRISKETQKIIKDAAKKHNFTPNLTARGLRLKKSHTIGISIPDISNPFFSTIVRGLENEFRKSGYSIVLCDSQDKIEIEIENLQILKNRNVDGLIVCPVGTNSDHLVDILKSIPLIIIDRYFPELPLQYVSSNNYQGAYDAVNYLVSKGHRDIACIQGIVGTSPNDERIRGYRDALIKHKIDINETNIVGGNYNIETGYIETKLLLTRKNPPTAMFTFSNMISLGALKAIKEDNKSIPEDISIISFDDHPYSDFLHTPLNSVRQQIALMGNISAKLILDRIKGVQNYEQQGVLLPTEFIERQSVKNLK